MVNKPVIFVSSTSDLRSARDLVGKVLYSMGYEPIWQDIEAVDGGELLDIIRQRVRRADAMIQLVGSRYGAEPPYPSPEFGWVSYTQFESLFAESLKTRVIYHFLTGDFPASPAAAEPDELRAKQAEYRQQISIKNLLHQPDIDSPVTLELSVRRITDELTDIRVRAERRFRRLMWVASASAVAIVVVAILIVHGVRGIRTAQLDQDTDLTKLITTAEDTAKRTKRIEDGLLEIKQQDAAARPVLASDDQAYLRRQSTCGDLLSRVKNSVLQPDVDTDTLLDKLKEARAKDPHYSSEYEMAVLEGKRWYFNRPADYDRAAQFFDTATNLKSDEVEGRLLAIESHNYARKGDTKWHQKQAVEGGRGTLGLVQKDSLDSARLQTDMGNAYFNLTTSPGDGHFYDAIEAYGKASEIFDREGLHLRWATVQSNLGLAFDNLTADRPANLERAKQHFAAAFQYRTRNTNPDGWATTKNNLGIALGRSVGGSPPADSLRAIEVLLEALEVRNKDTNPRGWAETQMNLGNALCLSRGDPVRNFTDAVKAYSAALPVFKETDPDNWARTQAYWADAQYCLGFAYERLSSTGDRSANLHKAVTPLEAALAYYTKSADPATYAKTKRLLGIVWGGLRGESPDNLVRAIKCLEEAQSGYAAAGLNKQEAEMERALWTLRKELMRKQATTQRAGATSSTKNS